MSNEPNEAKEPEHPCPKCGKEMEYLPADSDGDGAWATDVPRVLVVRVRPHRTARL